MGADVKEYVLMSKDNGEIALGRKLQAFDNPDEQIMNNTKLGKIVWLPKDPDFWAISNREGGPFTLLPFSFVNDRVEVIAVI